jgi:hypothetical protein
MQIKSVFAMTLAAGAAFAAVPATAQSYNATRVIGSVTLEDLQAIVGDIGHEIVTTRTENAPFIAARTPEGVVYAIEGRACTDAKTDCKGILIEAAYSGADNVTDENIARADRRYAAVNASVNRERDDFRFTRYLILDDGVTMANIRANVTVFLALQPLSLEIAKGGSS